MLLKLDTREAEKKEEEGEFVARTGYTEFVSHTVWAHQMDFEEWKRRCDAAEQASSFVRPASVACLPRPFGYQTLSNVVFLVYHTHVVHPPRKHTDYIFFSLNALCPWRLNKTDASTNLNTRTLAKVDGIPPL